MIVNKYQGQGGGSGSGSTVSWRQDLSAGTQIAQITINGTSQAVYAPEGGEGGDYQVVSQLPASAEEGQLFYVLAHSGTTTLSGWEIYDITDNTLVGSVVVGFEEEGDIYEVFIDVETGEGGNFTLNGDQIGTSNTFREMGSFDNRVDLIAKCDGEGHCWIYLLTPGDERRFDFTPEDETATIEDSTYDYPGEIVPAATYRYLDGQFVLETLPVATDQVLGGVKIGSGITVAADGTISVSGGTGGDGLVHLETLSGATGETNVVYECDDELFWWNENSGYTGFWANGKTTSDSLNALFDGLTFSTPPQGTVLMTFGTKYNTTYLLMFAGDTLVGVTGNSLVFEVEPGTIYTKRLQGFDIRIKYDKHYIGICMEPISPNRLVVSQVWDGKTYTPHWELVDKNVYPYVYATSEAQFYQVNKKGLPVATGVRLSNKVSYINGSSYVYYAVNDFPNMYVPTTGGTAGQILQSNGNAAPTWVDMPAGGGPTQYILNEMTQQERLALYNELLPYSGIGTGTIESAFTPSDYAFYLRGDTSSFDWGDQFRGIIPMTLAFYSPGDYGGAFFFTGVAGGRYGNGNILKVRFNIVYDGTYDYSYHWVETPGIVGYGFNMNYQQDGEILVYDMDNSQFIISGNSQTTVISNTTAYQDINAEMLRRFVEDSTFVFNDGVYCTPQYKLYLIDSGVQYLLSNPSITEINIASTTVDGQTFEKKFQLHYFIPTGGRGTLEFMANNDGYAAGFTFTPYI